MGKIKLNLISGAVVEKPLISAFSANNSSYVVLDNEMNGSMGLPIILVCKLENNKLTKIVDANEWGIVKEYLKNIIAGNKIEFIKINEEIVADDIYYTQLTLPVPSFDALRNAYKVEEVEPAKEEVTTIMDMFNTNTLEEPVQNVVSPVIEPTAAPLGNFEVNPSVNLESPVIDIPVAPIFNEPVIEPMPVVDIAVSNSVEPTVIEPAVTQVMPDNIQTPEVSLEQVQENVVETENSNSVFKEQKEAFMQACENMFDALVQKFEKELENHK